MKNYCPNCGQRLNPNDKTCSKCNTKVKEEKLDPIFKVFIGVIVAIIAIIVIIILVIIIHNAIYNYSHKKTQKELGQEYLSDKYDHVEEKEFYECRQCVTTCDGSCFGVEKIDGCFKYSYNVSYSDTEDVFIYSRDGKISVDAYTPIIQKYGFEDASTIHNERIGNTRPRNYLTIETKAITEENALNLYNMLIELIELHKINEKNNDDDFYKNIEITIREGAGKNNIKVERSVYNNHEGYDWDINHANFDYAPYLNEYPSFEYFKTHLYLTDNTND